MKLISLLQEDTLSLSFEVFPPKTDSAFDSVKEATERIARLRPLGRMPMPAMRWKRSVMQKAYSKGRTRL